MRPFGRSTIWRERDNGCGPPIPHRPEKAEKSGALFWKTPELFLFDIEGAALLLFHVTDDGGAGDLIALL